MFNYLFIKAYNYTIYIKMKIEKWLRQAALDDQIVPRSLTSRATEFHLWKHHEQKAMNPYDGSYMNAILRK